MTSTNASQQRSQRIRSAAVVAHGRRDVDDAVGRVRALAGPNGVAMVEEPRDADLAVVLGGDGTILRTLAHLLGSGVPVIGVNFGRVGFLASISPGDLEAGLQRVFGGSYKVAELPRLEVSLDGATHVAVNDIVATSSTLGRMVELAWSIGGED